MQSQHARIRPVKPRPHTLRRRRPRLRIGDAIIGGVVTIGGIAFILLAVFVVALALTTRGGAR